MTTAKPIRLPNTPTTNTLVKIAQRIPCGPEPGRWGREASEAVQKLEKQIAEAEEAIENLPEVRRIKKKIEALNKQRKETEIADSKAWKKKHEAKCDLIDRIYLDGPTKQNIAAVKKALGL